jgi:hypothetical protein
MGMTKILLLGAIAIATLVAPASAAATLIVADAETGNGIEAGKEISLAGNFKFDVEGVGIECEAQATLESTTATGLDLTKFEIDTESCQGFGFHMVKCVVTKDTVSSLPWQTHIASSKSFGIADLTIETTNDTCLLTEVALHAVEVTATVDDASEISSLSLSGEATLEDNLGTDTAVISGELEVLDGDAATYAIQEAHKLTDEGEPLGSKVAIPFTGTAKFNAEGVGFECEVTATLETENASAGTTKLAVTTKTCKGFGFGMGSCSVTEDKSTGSPWLTHVTGTDRLSIVGTSIDLTSKSCLLTEAAFAFPEIVATVNSTAAIGSISLSGTGTAETNAGEGSVTVSGTLNAGGGTSETYEIDGIPGKEVLADVNGTPISNGTKLHLVGWAKLETLGTGIECHVTATYEATGTEGKTGNVTAFSLETATCHGFGSIYNGCKVTSDAVKNLPYAVKTTKTLLDITATNIIVESILSGCVNTNVTFTNLYLEEGVKLEPLKTGTRTVTNTSGHLGTTAATGEAIAGVELSGEGTAENNLGELAVEASGELELTSPERCTYRLSG